MDIRTKLIFALVSVALASMVALGLIMYDTVRDEFEASTVEQLEGLAELKAEAVEAVFAGWKDRVSLVALGSDLHNAMIRYEVAPSESNRDEVLDVLTDALRASEALAQLSAFDRNGSLVATTFAAESGPMPPTDLDSVEIVAGRAVHLAGVVFSDQELPLVRFEAPILEQSEVVGFLIAHISTSAIEALSQNYLGLGETGETMVVSYDELAVPRVLHGVRHDSAGGTLRFGGLPLNPEDRVARVLRGDLPRVERATTDYRGEGVWLAARAVPGIGWGVLVKIDESERRDPMLAFRAQTIRLALALSAFAIMLGFLFGFRLAQPIHLLAEAANRIRDGELHARSNIEREDEVGLLARTFDQMASKLEEQVGLLTEFRKFFDVSIDMMCIAHTDGTFKRVNPAFSRELGWSEDELLSRPFMDLVHPDDLGATVHEIDKLSTGRPTISFENRFLCKDGSFQRLRWNSYPEPETGLLYALARVQSTPAGEAP